jgi:hypothetical protein
MLLNVRLMGILNGILCVALFGHFLMRMQERPRSSRDRQGNWIVMFGFFLYGLGYLGVLFSKVIKAAVSRQREFLADASAVQFTRNPAGIGGALRKILSSDQGTRIKHAGAEEMSHLFFANGLRQRWYSIFATHPSLQERIRRVEGVHLSELKSPAATQGVETLGSEPLVAGIQPQGLIDRVGTITASSMELAPGILASIPSELRDASRNPTAVRPIIAGLFLSSDEDVFQRQKTVLDAATVSPDFWQHALDSKRMLEQLRPSERSIVLELAAPALAALPSPQGAQFCGVLRQLVLELPPASLYYYALLSVILSLIERPRKCLVCSSSADRSMDAALVLISAVCIVGSPVPSRQDAAFAAAQRVLPLVKSRLSRDACSLSVVERAMGILNNSGGEVLRSIAQAMAAAAATDGELTSEEVELVRISCLAFGCPIPAQF